MSSGPGTCSEPWRVTCLLTQPIETLETLEDPLVTNTNQIWIAPRLIHNTASNDALPETQAAPEFSDY